jgi:hypothetical protein
MPLDCPNGLEAIKIPETFQKEASAKRSVSEIVDRAMQLDTISTKSGHKLGWVWNVSICNTSRRQMDSIHQKEGIMTLQRKLIDVHRMASFQTDNVPLKS